MNKGKQVVAVIIGIFILVGLIIYHYNKDIPTTKRIKHNTSKIISDAVGGNVTTEVEVKKDGSVKISSNKTKLVAKRAIRRGEVFEVDLGIRSITNPIQFSDICSYFGISNVGLGVGLSINKAILGNFTVGAFGGLYGGRLGSNQGINMGIGLSIGYYWDLNKHVFAGYDLINSGISLGVGVRW